VQGQAETSSATVKLLQDIGQSTAALVERLQSQSDAAQRAHDERQVSAGDQLRGLIEQASVGANRTQAAATETSARMLKELGDAAAVLVRNLQEQASNAQQEHSGRQVALAAQTAELLAKQSEQIARLADAVQRAEGSMRDTVERIKAATDSHLDRLGLGAERMKAASDSLSDNLSLMKTSSDGLNGTADRLNAASGVLTTALSATQQTLADQKAVRDALAEMVLGLRTIIETAKREATVNASLVDQLQKASQLLIQAQTATVTNLEEATQAIGDAHGAFAKQVEATLRDGNRVFHEELAQATGLLKGAIQDLGDVLDNLPTSA
jgi:chromosome segregation ATPase